MFCCIKLKVEKSSCGICGTKFLNCDADVRPMKWVCALACSCEFLGGHVQTIEISNLLKEGLEGGQSIFCSSSTADLVQPTVTLDRGVADLSEHGVWDDGGRMDIRMLNM